MAKEHQQIEEVTSQAAIKHSNLAENLERTDDMREKLILSFKSRVGTLCF